MTTYDKAWKRIDSLLNNKGLTESALTEVNKVYEQAKKEKNDAQQIKALIFRAQLRSLKEEAPQLASIREMEAEIAKAPAPARAILENITAGIYWSYFQQNRWRLYDRSATVGFQKNDVATWSADDFHRRISELFLASLKNEKQLQQTKLEPFDAIILKGTARHLHPTLFDLLAYHALQYFKTDERNLNKPADAFEITDPVSFSEARSFATYRFSLGADSTSLHAKALRLYQRLIAFHLADAKPDALIDVDIDRLVFVNSYAVMENKTALYRNALEQLTAQYPQMPIAAQAWYLLANTYAEEAAQYQPLGDTSHRYAYLKAKAICEQVVKQKDSSEGKANCLNLLNTILRSTFNLHTEKVNQPNQPFRMLVTYRNITQLHLRVIKLDKKTRESLGTNTWEDKYWQQLTRLPAIKTFTQSLPDTRDHQQHRVEIKADGLPVGEYAFIASTNSDFSMSKNPMAVHAFYVSGLSYIHKDNHYFVLDRETGAPIVRAVVQVYYNAYDNTLRKTVERPGENMVTDKNGHFVLYPPKTNTNTNYRLEVSTKEDRLSMDEYNYHYWRDEEPEERNFNQTYLFTDRSIYRPGQTLYFKGLVINQRGQSNQNAIVANFATSLALLDVNGQQVDSLRVTTNEYGAYSGKFTLPSNLLNGSFRLVDEETNGSVAISVEEYKRPKFSTEIVKPAGSYRLNDSITVTGTAKAYAGNNVDGAAVKYRVVRKTVMPLWFYGWGRKIWPPYGKEETEVAHGTTVTRADGSFTITFKALPDLSVPKQDQPTFHFEVSADVTDINGETRSGNTTVMVAWQALRLNVELPDRLPADSLKKLRVTTTNANNLFEQARVNLSIYKLDEPKRIFRSRYWEQPDQFVLSKQEYYAAFPYDIYSNENVVNTWQKLNKVAEVTDTTTASGAFDIGKQALPAGWYVMEATTKDKFGEPVKAVHHVYLYTTVSQHNPVAMGVIQPAATKYEPGQTATYQLLTNLDNVFLVHDIGRKGAKLERKFLTLNGASPHLEIPLTENDRGGLGLQIAFVKHNRIYSNQVTLNVPFTNKELTISYTTYRDKTLPGSTEKWKVKITGAKGDQVAAEMLTAMYDASLDQFQPHNWNKPSIWQYYNMGSNWNGQECFLQVQSQERPDRSETWSYFNKNYDQLLGHEMGFAGAKDQIRIKGTRTIGNRGIAVQDMALKEVAMAAATVAAQAKKSVGEMKEEAASAQMQNGYMGPEEMPVGSTEAAAPSVQPRKNFNETAFFFPDLHTDTEGNVEFSFTMPEALTQWKWLTLSHTKELAMGYSEKTIITQKELMVQPNAPRFIREGDRMDFSGKIVNLSNKELTGQVELQLIDPTTNQSVDGWFRNVYPNQFFTVEAGQSVPVSFSLEIPYQYNKPVTYRLIAASRAGAGESALSDGEENILPVLSNRMLVTETLPLPVYGNARRNFTFNKLLKSGESETLSQHALTVEYTSNPAWYAVQALPYLMEYPYECAEQVFNRYYANILAASIANATPRIKAVFERWKNADTAALLSNLQKNEELKSVLLQETPWVLEAKNEAQQKKNIALLFDLVRMSREQQSAIQQLQDMQTANGGFMWFRGGPEDRYITQYILTGIGHLQKLKALKADNTINAILKAALPYLDKAIKKDYDDLLKINKGKEPMGALSDIQVQYLYMRSFFSELAIPGESSKAVNYYRKQAQQHWVKQSKYMQGMIALAQYRSGDTKTALAIMASLKENALVNEEMGMYWKAASGYCWYQHPIETQALLIEAFTEVAKDAKAVAGMKTWLLKQKQTQNWRTTKATADACYALLLQGSDWLAHTPDVQINLGSYTIRSSEQAEEAGTGYFKKIVDGKHVNPEMGNIKVTVSGAPAGSESASWGAVYWQYFENLDKITTAETPLKLRKQLFVQKLTDRGPVLQPLNEGDALQVGDKVKVRIELRVDRAMEYVHMKDMRAACMEPVNVLSSYKWQGGLGYYESTKDASTNFFFGYLPKGTWVFEYPLFVTHTGGFSNGITTIQCMYAPEFTSHSEGVKVNVEAKQ